MTPGTDKVARLSRVYAAPPAKVFAAWTDPKQFQQWWGATPEATCPICEMDVRVGGSYRWGMKMPDKDITYVCYGEFREIVPGTKLVFTWSWEPPHEHVQDSVVTLDFRDAGDNHTELALTHQGLPSPKEVEDHTGGWTGCLSRLAAHVANE